MISLVADPDPVPDLDRLKLALAAELEALSVSVECDLPSFPSVQADASPGSRDHSSVATRRAANTAARTDSGAATGLAPPISAADQRWGRRPGETGAAARSCPAQS